jgi:hypothetical protein
MLMAVDIAAVAACEDSSLQRLRPDQQLMEVLLRIESEQLEVDLQESDVMLLLRDD